MKSSVLSACLIALAGCAGTVETSRLDYRYDTNVAAKGVSYALPMLQYEIEISHTLTGCGPTVDENGKITTDSLAFDTKVTPKARYIPGERYSVDYRKLSGLFRTSSFTIDNYPEGTIKSIGVSADDKTGDALKSAAKLAGGIVALTAGAPPFAPSVTQSDGGQSDPVELKSKQKYFTCSAKAFQLVENLNAAKDALTAAKGDLKDANDAVEKLSKRFALKVISDGDSKAWDDAVQDQIDSSTVLKEKRRAFDKAKTALTANYSFKWPTQPTPNSGEVFFKYNYVLNDSLTKPWAGLFAVEEVPYNSKGDLDLLTECEVNSSVAADINTDAKLHACLAKHMDMQFEFVRDWPNERLQSLPRPPLDSDYGNSAEEKARLAEDTKLAEEAKRKFLADNQVFEVGNRPYEGFFYREPARGGLVICLSRNWDSHRQSCTSDPLAKPEMVNFPQAGQLRFIPFRVLAFQGKEQTITFTKDGFPSKIELKSTKAAVAEALAATAAATTTVADALEKREEERRSDAKAARDEAVAELTTEISLLEKQAKITELTAESPPASAESVRLAEINSDIELKRAELLQMLLSEGIVTGTIDPTILFGEES